MARRCPSPLEPHRTPPISPLLNPRLANLPIADATPELLQRALDRAWPDAPTSWNDAHKHLSALFTYAIRHGLCRTSPMPAIDKRHDHTEAEIRALAPADLRRLFASCRPATPEERAAAAAAPAYERRLALTDTSHLRAYIALCAFAGVRPAECARLRWQDISEEDACVSVRAAASKTGGTRHIELHPTLAAWLRAVRPAAASPGDLITPATNLKWALRALRIRAGFGPARPWQDDCLRHSYATYYLKNGGSLSALQMNMGHATTQLIYTRYTNMIGITRSMAAEWWSILPHQTKRPAEELAQQGTSV